ncbi:MAG: alpha/beta hydrolase [Clostridia bacterium]
MYKSIFKKATACFLSLIMMFSLTIVAFGADDEEIPVIVISGMCSRNYYNSETGAYVVPPSASDFTEFLVDIAAPSFTTIFTGDYSAFAESFATELFDMLEVFSCDENGDPLYDEVVTDTYDEPISNYADYFDSCTMFQQALARSIGDEIGSDRTYYFNYDWRLSPLDHADDLNDMIESAKETFGVDKVKVVGLSMGGTILSSYIYKYGTDSLESITYASTAYSGVDLVGYLFNGELSFSSSLVLTYLTGLFEDFYITSGALSMASTSLSDSYLEGVLDSFLDDLVEQCTEPLYADALAQSLGTMLGLWSLVPQEDYESAKAYVSQYIDLSDNFWSQADEYIYSVQANADEMLIQAQEDGVQVNFVAAYGYSGIPATDATVAQTDVLIETENMLSNASVANYGETLEITDYTYASTDNVIDVSQSAFANTTWAIKSTTHVAYKYGKVTCDLLTWVVTADEEIDIYSNELYPQFVQYNADSNTFSSLTEGVTLEGDLLEDQNLSFFEQIVEFIKSIPNTIKEIFSLYILFFE